MVGEDGSYFGKGDLFFFLCNRFPDRAPLLKVPSYSVGSEEIDSWQNLYLHHEEVVGSFVWWSYRSGKDASG